MIGHPVAAVLHYGMYDALQTERHTDRLPSTHATQPIPGCLIGNCEGSCMCRIHMQERLVG